MKNKSNVSFLKAAVKGGKCACVCVCVCVSERAGGGEVIVALPSPQPASTRVGCQLETTHMTHLTPPLEPWLEIIGLFLQLNR